MILLLAGAIVILVLVVSFFRHPVERENTPTRNSSIPVELAIKACIYQDLLGKRAKASASKPQFGALFLDATEGEIPYLQSLFHDWLPRVEVGITNQNHAMFNKTGVVDTVTGKYGVIYWAKVMSHTNSEAQAEGGDWVSPVAGQTFNYQLAFNGTNWIIRSKKRGAVW